jgi:nitrate reductase (NAD(P)H)
MMLAGGEATEDFNAVHSSKAWDLLEEHYLGPLKSGPPTSTDPKPSSDVIDPNVGWLNPRKFEKLPLVEKIIVSHDTRIFRFGLPHPDMKLGLPTGMHIFLKAQWKGETVMRAYTPMTDDYTLGHFDLLVKVYFANTHPAFPDGGKMSQHLDSMNIGDLIDVKGPLGEFNYKGNGDFTWHLQPRKCSHISMIAGGTGLTPCWQLAQAVLRNPDDETRVSLLYANKSPSDILARSQLDQLQKEHPRRFKLWYTVDKVPEDDEDFGKWKFSTGFIDEQMIRGNLFEPGEGRIAVMCGPPIMQKLVTQHLVKYDYREDDIFAF